MSKILTILLIITCICGVVGAAYTYSEYTKYLEEFIKNKKKLIKVKKKTEE